MRRVLTLAMILAAILVNPNANAQTYKPNDPSGGLTIQYLSAADNGWAIVTFVETVSDIQTYCAVAGASSGPLQSIKVVWISLRSTIGYYSDEALGTPTSAANANFSAANSTGQVVFNQLLVAQSRGKKVAGITLIPQTGGWCQLFSVRML